MKIGEAVRKARDLQPSQIDEDQMVQWLQQLDSQIYNEVIKTHEGWEYVDAPNYSESDMEQEMIADNMYAEMYVHYLQARTEFSLGEFGHYNNSNAQFEAEKSAYERWYNRTHMPIQNGVRYW